MQGHKTGMSGSTIMSDPEQFDHLFQFGCTHVEIGEFPDMESVHTFLNLAEENQVTFGVHSPLIRSGSKYDMIESVKMPIEKARQQFEEEVAYLAEVGASYVLVHFPYFKGPSADPFGRIEEGLTFLSHLQEKYKLPIVCEPKLGFDRSPCNIEYLHQCAGSLWGRYGLPICIDLGDYFMAAKGDWMPYIKPLLPFTKVVHLHNVTFTEKGYFWSVLHPTEGGAYDMKWCIVMLGEGEGKYFIFEHTPHTSPSSQSVQEGLEWVRQLLS
ncbi:TIM barrel protein [Halobacillus litoralis]|uniref:TIM barrel protein n=1 Tax=Halobacillus litoralis TaxID=45668 RepID=UPI001CD4849F|nr:TIM barrel protein [Halobacillus litoralis]MCA0969984.1 TIM barrel protein [Halobacillus litoralis]